MALGYKAPFSRHNWVSHRLRPAVLLAVSATVILFYLHRLRRPMLGSLQSQSTLHQHICPTSALADEVLVILRTGATESREKLPVHLETIMTCVPDYVIYSDYQETIAGHRVHDILADVDNAIKDSVPEFQLYNQLRTAGRDGLTYETLYGSGPGGALENPGWKLDKWKFLPMVDRAVRDRPNAKWFVFIEADTYMLWQNMLEYLSKFDADKPYYLGKHMYINGVLFGHGGSGFMLSNPAARMVSRHWRSNQERYDAYTKQEWAGDCILGKALKDVGVDMFWSFPHLQGDSLTTIDWNVTKVDRQPWCYSPATFHHMNRLEIRRLWQFEQDWLRNGSTTPRFADMFKSIAQPILQSRLEGWDNLSSGTTYSAEILSKMSEQDRNALVTVEREAHLSFDHCRSACDSKPSCLQFSYRMGICGTSQELKLGHSEHETCFEYSSSSAGCSRDRSRTESNKITSGWIVSRVAQYVKDLDQSCRDADGHDWVT